MIPRREALCLGLIAVILTVGSSGCAKHRYSAHKLPQQYQAPPVTNAQTLNLTQLAGQQTLTDAIETGDLLDVTISAGLGSGDTTTIPVRVRDDGIAQIPLLGPVQLAGLDLEEAEAEITTACIHRGLYRAPHVTVGMKRPRVHRVTVLGGVKKPGQYKLARGNSTLLDAITEAGGLSADSGTNVEVRVPSARVRPPRDQVAGVEANAPGATGHSRPIAHAQRKETAAPPRTYTVSLTSLQEGTVDDSQLPDGSVVMVEKKPAQTIQVIGLVSRPDRYAYPPGQELRMLDAIALAKGISSKAADKVLITRAQGEGADPVVIVGSIRNAQKFADANLRLQPGDVVSVEQTPATVFVDLLYMIRFNSPLTAFF